jgi:hypothetical protein
MCVREKGRNFLIKEVSLNKKNQHDCLSFFFSTFYFYIMQYLQYLEKEEQEVTVVF